MANIVLEVKDSDHNSKNNFKNNNDIDRFIFTILDRVILNIKKSEKYV